ncbi:translocase [Streptococcus pneumoniae 2070335]|nr:translocase [Streptococcus pneumoniae 2070335]
MYNLLLTILLVLSVVIVIAIFMQPTKTNPAMYLMPVQVICLNAVKLAVLKL